MPIMLRIRKELDKLNEINSSLVMEVMQLVVKYEMKDITPFEEEFKYLDELQLSQEFQEAQQEYIEYENKVQQTEDNQLDDSSEEEKETTGEIEESEEDLDDFSFYNEEKPLENLQLDIKNQYNSLSLLYNSLTKEEKMNIGSLQGFIDSYKNSEIETTEEFLIEELKCRKNK
jgi:hypothetical protein